MVLNLQCGAGQGRLLVNLSKPSYTTGTAGTSNNAFFGVGTNWVSSGLPGATHTNPGAITFTADNEPNFPGGTLQDYYPIVSLQDDTHGHFYTRKAVGQQYQGLAGATPGPYTMLPSAIVMAISPTTNPQASKVVLSNCPASWWSVGDLCECAISPDIDVVGMILRAGMSSHGGNYDSFIKLWNDGRRQFQAGLSIAGDGTGGFAYGAKFSNIQNGIKIINPSGMSILMEGNNTALTWQPDHGYFEIVPDPATKSLVIKAGGVVALRIGADGSLHGNIQP